MIDERVLRAARRFPLVPRPRPRPQPLPQRLATIAAAAAEGTARGGADRAAVAHNLAALTAADHGHPDLARYLCWTHHRRYRHKQPWAAPEARRALEPLVNLARLRSRHREPDAAIAILESLLTATRHGTTALVDQQPIDLGRAVLQPQARAEVHRWLWTIVVAEGIKALNRAGRWRDAHHHAQDHHGIGATLLDGRQVLVLAQALDGNPDAAAATLRTTQLAAPWQHAVHNCLTVWLDHARDRSGTGPLPSAAPAESSTTLVVDSAELPIHLVLSDLLGKPTADGPGVYPRRRSNRAPTSLPRITETDLRTALQRVLASQPRRQLCGDVPRVRA